MTDQNKTARTAAGASTRRDLLKLGLAGLPAAAVAGGLGGTAAAAAESTPPSSLGLRKTEHVKKFLDSCR